MYKHERDIPQDLRRQIHSLSALLENADLQFSNIAIERQKYIESIDNKKDLTLLSQPITIDSLRVYASQMYPEIDYEFYSGQERRTLDVLKDTHFASIGDIDKVIKKTSHIIKEYKEKKGRNAALANIWLSLGLIDKRLRILFPLGSAGEGLRSKYEKEFDT
ncbi:MAG: hypothetical protein Q8N09_06485 [Thermodesulfovibrionia bacterium]|nr:hypothetical protein [Thermodesulfovibrionia bacterium]